MATQIKFTVPEELAERFKRAVLEKHGKLELSKEGAVALRGYLRDTKACRGKKSKRDPILDVIGLFASSGRKRYNALVDKKALYEE